eukprot:RCo007572
MMAVLLLALALSMCGSEGALHTRTPGDAAQPVLLGALDELRLVLPSSSPSSGYTWVPDFDSSVFQLAASSCLRPRLVAQSGDATGSPTAALFPRVGQACKRELWFVGKRATSNSTGTASSPWNSPVAISVHLRRPWEGAHELSKASHTFHVAVEGPYRGMRLFPKPAAEVEVVHGRVQSPKPTATSSSFPSVYDPRNSPGFPTIEDQGTCGSCWAFGTTGMFEIMMAARFGRSLKLSPQYLLSCNTDGYTCDAGGFFAHEYHYQTIPPGEAQAGAVLASEMPYLQAVTPCGSPHNHVARINSGTKFIPNSEALLASAIYQHGVVGFTLVASTAFVNYGSTPTIIKLSGSANDVDHAAVLVGYNFASSPHYWIVRNSWGANWGMGGYAYISTDSDIFHTHWVSYTAPAGICEGGTLQSSSGVIQGSGAVVRWCSISIAPAPNPSTKVTLTFLSFCARNGKDSLTVSSGSTSVVLSNCTRKPSPLVVSGPVTLQWVVGPLGTATQGFQVRYDASPGVNCTIPTQLPVGYRPCPSDGNTSSCTSTLSCDVGFTGLPALLCLADRSPFNLSGCSATCASFSGCPSTRQALDSPATILCHTYPCTIDECCATVPCQYLLVDGMVQTQLNGFYARSVTVNGRPSFLLLGGRAKLFWTGANTFISVWLLGNNFSSNAYYAYLADDVADPSLSTRGWTVYNPRVDRDQTNVSVACTCIFNTPDDSGAEGSFPRRWLVFAVTLALSVALPLGLA